MIVGAAVTLLCADDERQTDDIDTLAGSALEIAMQVGARQNPPVNVSARGDMFDNYLPEDWESRRRQVFPFSPGSHHLRVFVPCPEDLAVMKVFRFLSKDQDDLYRLAQLPTSTGICSRNPLFRFLSFRSVTSAAMRCPLRRRGMPYSIPNHP